MTAKIFRNAFLIGFTVLLACILLFFFIMYSNYQAQAFDNLAIEAEHISEGMQICGGESYLSAVQSGERITWIAADGSVLYDNMADSSTMENHLQRPEVAEAFETGSGRSDRYSSTILEKNNYYALLLKDGTVLRVAGKQTSLAAMALMLVQPSLWIVVLVLVLCGLLAMRLARQIVRPINAINPDNPNATPTYPELQPLITRLQEQNRTIRTQLSELSTRQREFDAITENMREGFLIVDNKCSILSSNRSALRLLGIDDAHFRSGFMAMDGDVNLMKAAIVASTAVTTVSPSYAEEIQTEYYGYRLDSVLRMNSYKLHGILNGIDMDAFNPQTDTKIFKQYGPKTPEDKLVNKTELLKLCGLEGDANTPVIGIVTRFVDQKGLDLVEAVLPDILSDDVRLVVLGTGDWKYEQMFIEAKRRWPDKVSASIMFSGDLANRIYAGADMFLMPSKFEPCGLAQMIALRYGNIPIVRETGGLKDTVHAFVDYAGTGNGFSFASYNAHDMLHVIREACGVFRFNKPAWKKLMVQGMESDFSWDSSADRYIEVYHTALGW